MNLDFLWLKLLLDASLIFVFDLAALPAQIAQAAQLGMPNWAVSAIWGGRAAGSKIKITDSSRRSFMHSFMDG